MQKTQDTQIQSPGQEDALEKGVATHSSVLVWKISWTEESGGPQSIYSQKGQTQVSTTTTLHL